MKDVTERNECAEPVTHKLATRQQQRKQEKKHQGQRQQQPSSSPRSNNSVVRSNHGTVHTHTGLFRDVYQQTARWVSNANVGACARVRAQLPPAYLVERTKASSARRASKEASEQPMLWGTLEHSDIKMYHPVLTVRPESPALQASLIFEDAPLICFRNFRRCSPTFLSP